ncbi:MAG: glycoside hydrolase family protein [Helicobacteraceae bacterium]|nr:glycoside hydrolase family protein [Helicobacteraceae bacterium]
MSYEKAKQQIKEHEGFRLKAYLDTLGYWTIGYGHLLGKSDHPAIETIDKDEAEKLFEVDFEIALKDAKALVFEWDAMGEARQAVVINMAFNLGFNKLRKFAKMISHIEGKRYAQASIEMLDSLWAKQVGKRSTKLSRQMETGEWQK